MAQEDFKTRRRREEKEREKAARQPEAEAAPQATDATSVDLLLRRFDPLLEQVNALVQQFVLGVEKKPPLEMQKQLETLVTALLSNKSLSPGIKYRVSAALQRYQTLKSRWERILEKR